MLTSAILFAGALIYNRHKQGQFNHSGDPMPTELSIAAAMLVTYLAGSISTAVIVCKLLTLPDPRASGSLNPGATNVRRIGGNLAAFLTLVGDMAKAGVPLLIAKSFDLSQAQMAWLGVAAIIGHCFPLYYHFRGGKGVASMAAILMVIKLSLALLIIGCWLIAFVSYRRSGIAAVISATALPVYGWQFFPYMALPISLMCLLILIRHRQNILDLFAPSNTLDQSDPPTTANSSTD